MSEEATLDEFTEEGTEEGEQPEQKIPEGWQVHRADEIMEISRGASPRPKGDPELFGGDIPWVKIGDVDVKNARYTGETEDTVTDKGAKKSKLVEEGTLLVSNSGTCGYPMFAGRQSCVHDGWLILRDYEDSLNPHYLYEYINWKQNYLKSLAPGSTQINLNTSRFGVLEINTPPLSEQRKIATILDIVDQAIEKSEKIGEQTKRVKKALAQELIHTGIQKPPTKSAWMGKISSHWDVREFSEIIELCQNGIYKSKDEYGGTHPIIKMGDIFGGVKLDEPIDEQVYLDDDEIDKYGTVEGDLVFARHAQAGWGAGDCTYIPEMEERAVVESNMVQVRLNDGVDPLFYAQYFNSEIGIKSIKRSALHVSVGG